MGRTFDLLKQAEEKFQSQLHQKKNSNEIDSILCKLGIEEEIILQQNQNQIIRSLALLNQLIEKPEHLINSVLEGSESEVKSKSQIMIILISLKRIALFRYHYLFTKEQFENIKQATKEVHLESKKFIIEKSLYQLQIKDQILKNEFEELFQVIRLLDISTSDTQ